MGFVIVFLHTIRNEGIVGLNDWINVGSCIMMGIIYGIVIGTVYGTVKWRINEKK